MHRLYQAYSVSTKNYTLNSTGFAYFQFIMNYRIILEVISPTVKVHLLRKIELLESWLTQRLEIHVFRSLSMILDILPLPCKHILL